MDRSDELSLDLARETAALRRIARGILFEPSLAEDAVQEAWLAALRTREHGPRAGGWLTNAVRNIAHGLRRDEARRERRERASARGESALKLMPGGSIRPFCEPLTVTSTPHSSWRKSALARPEMLSTIKRAGWPAASMAWRTAAMSEVTPVEVSLCTTHTALIFFSVSWRSRASISSACTPRRQLGAFGNWSSLPA